MGTYTLLANSINTDKTNASFTEDITHFREILVCDTNGCNSRLPIELFKALTKISMVTSKLNATNERSQLFVVEYVDDTHYSCRNAAVTGYIGTYSIYGIK